MANFFPFKEISKKLLEVSDKVKKGGGRKKEGLVLDRMFEKSTGKIVETNRPKKKKK